MKLSLQRLFSFLFTVGLCVLAACGGGGDGGSGPGVGPAPPAPPPPPPPAATTVRVKVLDVLGFAKAGAKVSVAGSAAASADTASDGTAQLTLTPDTEQLLEVRLPGHTTQFKPVRVSAGQAAYVETRLMARAPALTLADAAAGGTLVGRNAARLTLPPNALVDAASGAPVTGAVQVEMTPVNTSSHEINAFPGTMRAITTGNQEVQLVTYGPVEYIFTQAGRRLALAPGQTAVIDMPLHAAQAVDGSPLAAGGTMPVWSLDERTGIWKQEGEGTIVASNSSTGLALRATVGHFSWWNPDFTSERVRVNINFVFPDGATPTECCHLEAFTTPGFPGPSSLATTTLPATGGNVVVNAPTVLSFLARGQSTAGPLVGGVLDRTVPVGVDTINLTITLRIDPNAPNPIITSPAAGVTTYTRDTVLVQASVSGNEPNLVELRANNALVGAMAGTQATGYSLSWNTTSFNEGSYAVRVRAVRGDVSVLSEPRTVVVDRTPPQVVLREPAPGSDEAAAVAGISATFNEPLDPQSLFNPDNPTLRLVAVGATGITPLPVTVALSSDGLKLTATPATALSSNTSYTVFVQGLTDRAGNVMVPVQWNFSVPLWAVGSPDLRTPDADGSLTNIVLGRPEVALASNGAPLVAWQQQVDNVRTIQAARLIDGLWVTLPALVPTGQPADLSMALDGSGQPVLAWTQTTANTAGCNVTTPTQLLAARFNGSAWQPLGGNLNIEPCSQPNRPRLKVDAAGRPVLVSAQGFGGRTIQVLRFQEGDWALLGAVPVQSVPSLPFPVTELRLAVDGNVPYVLRSENRSGSISHFVSRFDGTAFVPVGPQVATGNRDVRGALVIDPQGRPVVAVKAAAEALQVLRFEDSSWVPLGSAPAASPFINEPSIVFEGNEPIVAWREDLVAYVRRYDAATQDWAPRLTLRTDVGALSELQRQSAGGAIWGALTTGPFRRELRAVTTTTLP